MLSSAQELERRSAETSRKDAMIERLPTPALLLDKDKLDGNLKRLAARTAAQGVVLRPHMKTAKSIDVARRIFPTQPGPITVSTLAEAEYFAAHGFRDMTYAVGLSPQAAERAMALRKSGVDLKLLLDSVEQASALGAAGRAAGVRPSAFIEIDCDGHRGGLTVDHPELLDVAEAMKSDGVALAGILTHAGESYALDTPRRSCARRDIPALS